MSLAHLFVKRATNTVARQTREQLYTLGIEPNAVIVDNCEHLIETAAAVSDALLGACPGLKILATSREPTSADFGVSDSEYAHIRATVARWRDDLAREQRRAPPEIGR